MKIDRYFHVQNCLLTFACLHFFPDEIRDCIKDETQLSVVVGDVAHVTFVIARILGKNKNKIKTLTILKVLILIIFFYCRCTIKISNSTYGIYDHDPGQGQNIS